VKISVSLPKEDIDYLDLYAERAGISSRSAAVHEAVRVLRADGLEGAYAQAWDEWEASEDSELWEATASDGAADAAR
jgi:Arc/MetJ-type ribon-helix-helix transcriptional regulator